MVYMISFNQEKNTNIKPYPIYKRILTWKQIFHIDYCPQPRLITNNCTLWSLESKAHDLLSGTDTKTTKNRSEKGMIRPDVEEDAGSCALEDTLVAWPAVNKGQWGQFSWIMSQIKAARCLFAWVRTTWQWEMKVTLRQSASCCNSRVRNIGTASPISDLQLMTNFHMPCAVSLTKNYKKGASRSFVEFYWVRPHPLILAKDNWVPLAGWSMLGAS